MNRTSILTDYTKDRKYRVNGGKEDAIETRYRAWSRCRCDFGHDGLGKLDATFSELPPQSSSIVGTNTNAANHLLWRQWNVCIYSSPAA